MHAVMHMSLSINLRGDLAKLSDAELAERLTQAWTRYESADSRRRSTSLFWRRRRTTNLPLPYRIWTGFHGSPGFRVIDWALRALISSYTHSEIWMKKPLLVSDAAIEVDDHIGEILMITSEIKRRVDRQKAPT
jgi:hypothetical protein